MTRGMRDPLFICGVSPLLWSELGEYAPPFPLGVRRVRAQAVPLLVVRVRQQRPTVPTHPEAAVWLLVPWYLYGYWHLVDSFLCRPTFGWHEDVGRHQQ